MGNYKLRKKGDIEMCNGKKVKIENIIQATIIYECCSSIVIPKKCFEKIDLTDGIDLVIRNDYDIIYGKGSSPGRKIIPFDDLLRDLGIMRIMFLLENGEKVEVEAEWEEINPYTFMQTNSYQKNELLDFRTLSISIKKDNRSFSLSEILDKPGKKFKDESNNIYEVLENGKINTYISKELLNNKFYEI